MDARLSAFGGNVHLDSSNQNEISIRFADRILIGNPEKQIEYLGACSEVVY
jgi:hypothetical protein